MKRELKEISHKFKIKKVVEYDQNECECLALAIGGGEYYRKIKIPSNQVK
jgi:hypothetical protein